MFTLNRHIGLTSMCYVYILSFKCVYVSTSVLSVLFNFLLWVWYSKKKNYNFPFSIRNHPTHWHQAVESLWESNAEMRNLHLQSSRPCSCCPRRLGSKASPKGVASFFVANGLFVILIKRDPHRYCWVLHIWLDDPFNLSWTIMGGIKIVSLKLKALAWNPYWEEDSCQAWNELWHWQDSIIITSEVYVSYHILSHSSLQDPGCAS